jgi:hypothetical protein
MVQWMCSSNSNGRPGVHAGKARCVGCQVWEGIAVHSKFLHKLIAKLSHIASGVTHCNNVWRSAEHTPLCSSVCI